jgi:hypothetical protein
MKLVTKESTYKSPKLGQGYFNNVFIEDVSTKIIRKSNTLEIVFAMFSKDNGITSELNRTSMIFKGLESEIPTGKTTNQPSIVQVENPDYEVGYEIKEEDTDEVIKKKTTPSFRYNMIEWLTQNKGELNNATVIDFGYPTFEKAIEFFNGGDLKNPELTLSDQISIGFLLSKLIINGEPAGNQFTYSE